MATFFPLHGFLWGVVTGCVLIVTGIAIWNWRHPD